VDFVRRKAELREVDIRGMHKMLLVEPYQAEAVTPDGQKTKKWIKLGEYKSEPNQVTTPTGAIKSFTLPEDTPAKMADLLVWYRRQIGGEQQHPVITAALLHHQFVAIHPFDDGNGRMARIFMNLVLMQSGFPPVIIPLAERDAYYFALGKADAGETNDLVTYIAEKLIASQQLYLRGARGESIEDADDLDKKLALLSKELEQVPEPVALTDGIYRDFIDGSFRHFLTKLVGTMSKFDKFFSQRNTSVQSSQRYLNFEPNLNAVNKIVDDLKNDPRGHEIFVRFSWTYLKAKPLEHFGCSADIKIRFNELYFELEYLKRHTRHLYAGILKPEQWQEIVSELAANVLKEMESEIKPPPPTLPPGVTI
jgi:prophage maintenance system killer protein